MRASQLARYALSDLSHRKVTSLLNVGAVSLAAVYILVLGFYGASIHGYQSDLLGRSLQTKIIAQVPDATNERLLLTDERLAELAELPGVAQVTPRVEINVQVLLDRARIESTRAVGSLPEDPTLDGARMAWGAAPDGSDAFQVALPLRFFEKLGGVLGDVGPEPARLVVEVERTTSAGLEQRESLQLVITGLLEHQEEERVYVPVALVRELELYCGSYKSALFGEHTLDARWDGAVAWVLPEDVDLVEDELALNQVTGAADGELTVQDPSSGRWAALDAGTPPAWLQATGLVASSHAVVVEQIDGVTVAVLAEDDPRWGAPDVEPEPARATPDDVPGGSDADTAADEPPAARVAELAAAEPVAAPEPAPTPRLWALDEDARELLRARGLEPSEHDGLPEAVGASLVVDTLGWQRLTFDPRLSDGVRAHGWVTAHGPRAVAAVAELPRAAPPRGLERGWVFLSPPEAQPSSSEDATAAATDDAPLDDSQPADDPPATSTGGDPDDVALPAPTGPFAAEVARLLELGLSAGPWARDTDDLAWSPVEARLVVPARRVPAAFLREALDVRLGPRDVVLAAREADAAPRQAYAADGRRVVERIVELPLDVDEVWTLGEPGVAAPGVGLLAWGAWDGLLAAVDELGAHGWVVESAPSVLVDELVALVEGDVDTVIARLGADVAADCRIETVLGVPARVAGRADLPVILASTTDIGVDPIPGVRLVRDGTLPDELALEGSGWDLPSSGTSGFADLPERLVLVPEEEYAAAAWGSSTRRRRPAGAPRHDLHFDDPSRRDTAVAALADVGLALRPLDASRPARWLRYRIDDPLSQDGRLDDDLLRQLAMASPPFRDVRPAARLEVGLDGVAEPVPLLASAPDDPERFSQPVVSGTWLRDDLGANQVVLPRAWLGLSEDTRGHDVLGRSVSILLTRQLGLGPEEVLRLPLQLVGLVDGERAFGPTSLLADLARWRADQVVYDDGSGAFRSPADIVTAQGDLNCNVFATDVASVPAVVRELRDRGYETHDRLAEQQALARLGRVLGFLVVFFALGCAANAAITVCVATMMNVRSKIYEVGILRAHGLRRSEVLGIFAWQGALIGLAAFALAVLVVLIVEPFIRDGVVEMFSLDGGQVLAGSPFEARWWWVPTSAFAAAFLFSLVGVLWPAARACRLSPVEALRSRE